MKEEIIIASGPVIIEEGKLLVILDNKDRFYKLPGGTIKKKDSNLEETCIREVKEETNANIKIIKPLHPMMLHKNPETKKPAIIILIHYLAKLKNKTNIKPNPTIKEISWLKIKDIKLGKYPVAPNITYLIKKGDIK
jgi:ADP-ribose pyrophosphatase YjhB (NUDIX family)